MTRLRSWVAGAVAAVLTTAVIGVAGDAAAVPATPPDVCRVTFSITTGDDGIADDSAEQFRLAGRAFRFQDSDVHRGGTGDRANASFQWDAELSSCVPTDQLSQGFQIEHIPVENNFGFGDDWDLRAIQIADRDTGFVYYNFDASSAGRIHHFADDADQTWSTNGTRPEPALDNNVNPICRVTFRITTGSRDGLQNESIERIRLAGQPVLFEDSDGDGQLDLRPLVDFHSGGTDDLGDATFEWRTELSPCVPHAQLVHGFEFEHRTDRDELFADNWDLGGLTITDGDTGFVYFNLDSSGGRVLHRFRKNADQKWNTNQGRPTSDTDSDGDGLTDDWERHGLNADNDLTLDVNLPAMGANPNHKDIFLELDWVNGQQPTRAGIQAMKKAFAAAPLTAGSAASRQLTRDNKPGVDAPENPDHQPGITLHVDTGRLVDPTVREGEPTGTCSDGLDNVADGLADGTDPDCNAPRQYLDASVEDPGPPTCTDDVDNNEGGRGPADGDDPTCLVGDDFGGLGDGNQLMTAPNTCTTSSTAFNATKQANFDPNRRLIFHYGVLAPRPLMCSPFSGGQGELGGNDFISFNLDAGSLMHELGHNLNLRHGGFEDTNCKPNYVSVMNYDLQGGIPRSTGGRILDYSPPRIALDGTSRGSAPLGDADRNNDGVPDPLVGNNLTEPTILDPNDGANMFVFLNANRRKVPNNLNTSPDWDNDGSRTSTNVPAININGADFNGTPPGCVMNTSTTNPLRGWDDWSVVSLPFRQFTDAADGNTGTEPELEDNPTDEQLIALDEQLNTTDVGVDIIDVPDPVAAGSDVTYRLVVTNHGPTPAVSVRLVDTLPAQVSLVDVDPACRVVGQTVSCGLGYLVAYESRTVTITVHVPADLAHTAGGSVILANHATVDNLAGPDPNQANDSADETSTVIGAADLAFTGFAPVDPPTQALVGQAFAVTLHDTVTNNGPSSPIDATVVTTASADPGASVTPASSTRPVSALAAGETRSSDTSWMIGCSRPGQHTYRFTSTIFPAHVGDLDPNPANNQRTAEITVECLLPVAINIKPGGNPNSINIPADTVPVAVLTTAAGQYDLPLAFDATTIQPLTVHFGPLRVVLPGPGGAAEAHHTGHLEDAFERSTSPVERTRDGDLDMVLHFESGTSGLSPADTEACLLGSFTDRATGQTYRFFSCDAVRVVQP